MTDGVPAPELRTKDLLYMQEQAIKQLLAEKEDLQEQIAYLEKRLTDWYGQEGLKALKISQQNRRATTPKG